MSVPVIYQGAKFRQFVPHSMHILFIIKWTKLTDGKSSPVSQNQRN